MSEVATSVSLQADENCQQATASGNEGAEMQLAMVIKGTPIAKARPRFTRTGHVYTPDSTKQAEQAIAIAWIATANHRAPHAGSVQLRLQFVFTAPASWPKWRRERAAEGRIPHTTKPDLDNLTKLVKDALNGRAWIDDSQVVNTHARKDYGPEPLTRMWITFNAPAPSTKKESK